MVLSHLFISRVGRYRNRTPLRSPFPREADGRRSGSTAPTTAIVLGERDSTVRRVEQARRVGDLRPGGKGVQHPAVLAEDVLYGEAPYQEGIGDHPPVTTPPHRLRAHKADPYAAFAELDQSPEVGAELVGRHVVGVGAEGRVGPTRVRRVRSWRPASPQTRKARVPDALTRQ